MEYEVVVRVHLLEADWDDWTLDRLESAVAEAAEMAMEKVAASAEVESVDAREVTR